MEKGLLLPFWEDYRMNVIPRRSNFSE